MINQRARRVLQVIVSVAITFGWVMVNEATAQDNRAEWQKHADWCTTDPRDSGAEYRDKLRRGYDHYDAVLGCQNHNAGAIAAVAAAGRAALNAYLGHGTGTVITTAATTTPTASTATATTTGTAIKRNPNHDAATLTKRRLDYYVTAEFECVWKTDGSNAGSVEHRFNADSCDAAMHPFNIQRSVGRDFCSAMDSSKMQKGPGAWKWKHGGPCSYIK